MKSAILINKHTGFNIRNFIFLLVVFSIISGLNASAQYFGRNKPGYRNFKYSVLQTPNFEIYHYLRNDSLLNNLAQWSEKWYQIHQRTFKDTFNTKNPVIFYNNHADFQQTNTISGLISSGTGGVTESLKNRVIMPVAPTLAQTDHTLGHELVHAFQFNMLLNSDSSRFYSLRNMPLWMIEGMAEYLSLGSVDPNTAMWMRDALKNDDFPTLKKLETESRYFPYRYGHAFWAMAGKTWGDTIILPLFKKTAQFGFNAAVDSVLGFNEKTISGMWKSAMELHFKPYFEGKTDKPAGKKIISDRNAGRFNISPAISPDGKYIAFFSEKNLFTLDLFLADANNGRIIKKLSSVLKNSDIDDFNFIESAGTWSPDSKKFAFVIFSKGKNKLAIVDVIRARKTREIEIKGITSFYNPSWSPDGRKIVFTGMVDGISDLYLYYLNSGSVERLTSNLTSNIHPSWSSDGNYIVFSQEIINSVPDQRKFSFNLAVIDLMSRTVTRLDVFNEAYNLNPFFSKDGRSVYFLSDADGFRNLYNYSLDSQSVYKLTDYITGISGITPFSPAISVAPEGDLIVYTYYINNKYQIWIANTDEFEYTRADKNYVNFDAGTLPPLKHFAFNLIDTTLYNRQYIALMPVDSVKEGVYRPKFKLDYISNNASIGVSTGVYRNNLGGSINMIFSDILGNSQLYSSLSLNGEIYDFGGQAAYINQKSKIKWGAALSHIPYRFGNMFLTYDSIRIGGEPVFVNNLVLDYMRMFEDNISGFLFYPISQNRRLEANFSTSWYYYRIDRFNNYFLPNGLEIGGTREKLDAPRGNNYQQISLAYIEDNSYFGMTSPMQGHRARFQLEKYFSVVDFYTALVDYRKYFFIKPFSMAFRAYHYGRYGSGVGNSIISPLYLGYPWLIRGYENVSFSDRSSLQMNSFNVSRLSGERTLVANAEFRIPVTGPERLALIKSRWFLTDFNLFFDGGLAWSPGDKIILDWNPSGITYEKRYPIYSTGASLRINVLGALIIEPYYAFPLQNGGFSNGVFGINFVPGW
jgi:Tol biopolymer transport system component